jgi:predicted DNA-binding protein (UPF0251 family)
MRPKKTRWVACEPGERCFRPLCKPLKKLEGIILSLDEFEAVRLHDLCGMNQEKAAQIMRISRPTFSRILTSAHKKVADGLVNIKAIRIEGGCCNIKGKKRRKK